MKNIPLISVIVITFKRINLLTRTIASIQSSTQYPNLEFILCDDGSPEDIQNEMQKLPFDKFLFSKKNEGIGANTNKGIREASGEFIFQLQDDWVYTGKKDFLENGIEALLSIPDLGIVRYRVKDSEKFLEEKEISLGVNNRIFILKENHIILPGYGRLYSDTPHLKRKSLHKEIGFYLENKNIEKVELDFCNRCANQNLFKVAYIFGYKDVFEHIGEEDSFRAKTLKNRITKNINDTQLGRLVYDFTKKIIKR